MASRFWIGGAGNWSDTANWSTTSGGAGGASVPGAADSAVFNSSSDSGANFTATVDVPFTVQNLTFTTVDRIITFGTAGNLTVNNNTAISASNTTNGLLLAGNASLGDVTITSGRLNINGNSVTMKTFSSSSAATIAFGTSGAISITGNNGTVWSFTTNGAINSTITGTGSINFTYSGSTGTRTIRNYPRTGATIPSFNISAGTDIVRFTTASYPAPANATQMNSLDFTGFSGTLSHAGDNSNPTIVVGDLTFSSGMSLESAATSYRSFSLQPTSGTKTITCNGNTLPGTLEINIFGSAGTTVTLADAAYFSINTTTGTFDTANFNVTGSSFRSATTPGNIRTVTLGSSTISCGTFTISGSGLTFNEGTSQINVTSLSTTFGGAGETFYNVSFTSTAIGTRDISGANTFNNLSFTASASGLSQLTFAADQIVSGTFTCAGSSAIARGFVRSNTFATPRTITAAVVSAADADFRDITIAGAAAPISPTRAGDCGGNSGITFPAAKTVYRVGTNTTWSGSASWATGSGGTGNNNNFPLAQDTAVIDNSTTLTGTLSIEAYNISALDCSTRTTGITLDHSVAVTRYGSYILGSGVTVSGVSTQTFSGQGTVTFTSAGKTITFPININSNNGTFQLGDAITTSSSVVHFRGTFDAVTYNLTCTTFASASSSIRTLSMGSGTWTLSGTGNVWNTSTTTNLTFNKGTANILLSDTSVTSRNFSGGGLTFNTLTIGGATGTSITSFSEANTFGELASTKTVAHTVQFEDNQSVDTWSIAGSVGNVVTLQSDTAATARTLTKNGVGHLTGLDYLRIISVIGLPVSDTWYIGENSTYSTTPPNYGTGFFLTQRADHAIVVLTSTSSTTWTVPLDWINAPNIIHIIGGGGGGAGAGLSGLTRYGGSGGGGGGYTRLNNQALTIGASITYQCGSAGSGGAVAGNGTSGGTTSWNSGSATAGGGSGAGFANSGASGGTGSTFNGGNGGNRGTGTVSQSSGAGGGGGGAGLLGAGGNGGNGNNASTTSGGGGGNGGGSNAVSSTGGANASGLGSGGAVGGGGTGRAGSPGIEVFGVGSGGGGAGSFNNGLGGSYGGGGGGGVNMSGSYSVGSNGAQGAIIIVYPFGQVNDTGNFFMLF